MWQWLIAIFRTHPKKCTVLTQLTDLCEYVNERIQSHFFGELAISEDPGPLNTSAQIAPEK